MDIYYSFEKSLTIFLFLGSRRLLFSPAKRLCFTVLSTAMVQHLLVQAKYSDQEQLQPPEKEHSFTDDLVVSTNSNIQSRFLRNAPTRRLRSVHLTQ